jgi:hypothetical protein
MSGLGSPCLAARPKTLSSLHEHRIRAPAGGVEPPIVALTGRRLTVWATPVLVREVGMAGFEPALSCSQGRRIEPGFPTSRTKCPAGVEPALPPWQGDRLPLHHGHILPTTNCQRNREHRVGLEPTSPHYGCGVFAARRPVLKSQWGQRGSNPHPPG